MKGWNVTMIMRPRNRRSMHQSEGLTAVNTELLLSHSIYWSLRSVSGTNKLVDRSVRAVPSIVIRTGWSAGCMV